MQIWPWQSCDSVESNCTWTKPGLHQWLEWVRAHNRPWQIMSSRRIVQFTSKTSSAKRNALILSACVLNHQHALLHFRESLLTSKYNLINVSGTAKCSGTMKQGQNRKEQTSNTWVSAHIQEIPFSLVMRVFWHASVKNLGRCTFWYSQGVYTHRVSDNGRRRKEWYTTNQ